MYFVYFLANYTNSTLYVGFTTKSLRARVQEHRMKLVPGFTKDYNLYKLVYFEVCDSLEQAVVREKQIKNWTRKKKDFLVNRENPEWRDLLLDLDE